MGVAGNGCWRLWLAAAVQHQHQLQLQRQGLAMAVAGNGGESLWLVLGSGWPLELRPQGLEPGPPRLRPKR